MRESRYAFIEAHLLVHGYVGRKDLMCTASVSGTKTLQAYRNLHPGAMTYNDADKRYERGASFTCHHLKKSAVKYLAAYTFIHGE